MDSSIAGNNVDKIRDILFGSQMRDYESRFARLEETLLKESTDLRESTKKRLDSLEGYLKKELESLASRLRAEREDRSAADKQLAKELKELAESLAAKIGEAEDHAAEGQADLRKELLEQSKNLTEEIRGKQEETLGALDRRFQELRREKTDRAALAALLTEVAMRLNDEFRMPDVET
jgi:hypothetical protein